MGNYLFKKLSNLDISESDLSNAVPFVVLVVSATCVGSSTESADSSSLNKYDPGVDGEETKSKQINSKSSCTSLYSPFFVKHTI